MEEISEIRCLRSSSEQIKKNYIFGKGAMKDLARYIDVTLERLEQDERVINKAIEILGEHRHYSSPTEEQNAQNEEIVNKAYKLLKDRKCE